MRPLVAVAALLCLVTAAEAQTIYPINRAEILAGARFALLFVASVFLVNFTKPGTGSKSPR